jgi:hypothetical protein
MPGPSLQTDVIVLVKRPPAESFQTFTVFSAAQGALTVLQRVPKKPSPGRFALDLFDEAALTLDGSQPDGPRFVNEARLLSRWTTIGRDYDRLRLAGTLTQLVARNPVTEESRGAVYALLQTALAAFATTAPAEVVWFKSLYCFARDEGYPVGQDWRPTLPADLRPEADRLLRTPLAALAGAAESVAQAAGLARRLESYLRSHTEIVLDLA